MRLPILAVLLVAPRVSADAIKGCPARESVTLGTRVAAKLDTTYELQDTPVRVCIDYTAYPLMRQGGHLLHACFRVGAGSQVRRYCGTADAIYLDRDGYRITVSLRRADHSKPPDVWLRIDPRP